MRTIVAVWKLMAFAVASLSIIVYQTVFLMFNKGPTSLVMPQVFHEVSRRILGLTIIVEGEIEKGPDVVYVSNHISYMDIQVLGSLTRGCFVSKKEIEHWPLFGYLGKMGRTLYISRQPADAERETKAMLGRLHDGIPLIIFPEGTSSDGKSVLPFKSSFFEILLNKKIKVQPITMSIIEVNGLSAADDTARDIYAWHGDVTLIPHLWRFFKAKGATVKVVAHPPITASNYTNRKALCADSYNAVVRGLDLLPANA